MRWRQAALWLMPAERCAAVAARGSAVSAWPALLARRSSAALDARDVVALQCDR